MVPSPPSHNSATLSLAAISVVCIVSSVVSLRRQEKIQKEYDALEQEMTKLKLRQEEEKRKYKKTKKAEINNTMEKNKSSQFSPRETLEKESSSGLLVKPIGTIRSIYRLCVGTPRQGLLAPNARGCIELLKLGDSSAASSVSGLEGFSHIWVLFVFHLNTQSSNNKTRIKTKIAPPALGGEKVGIFATRTPHRYNPIGITLCKLDRIEIIQKPKQQQVILHVSGLDLVDGTPVLDIKPYVPIYDSIAQNGDNDEVKLPHWVAGGLATKRNVTITSHARQELVALLEQDPQALQFYGPKQGDDDDTVVNYVLDCIRQVLAMDVRSSFQTKKARQGKSQAERSERLQNNVVQATTTATAAQVDADVCTQQLDNLLIRYKVEETPDRKRSSSENSGAEDSISVISIQLLTQKEGKK